MTSKYYIAPGPYDSNSFSVFDRTRKNCWGESWCVEPLVTWEEAYNLVEKLNKQEATKLQKALTREYNVTRALAHIDSFGWAFVKDTEIKLTDAQLAKLVDLGYLVGWKHGYHSWYRVTGKGYRFMRQQGFSL
jgi:hypothetical protein